MRAERGLFVAEGFNSVDAALTTGRATAVFVRDSDSHKHVGIVDRVLAAGLPLYWLSDRAADRLTETTNAPGLFAECTLLTSSLTEVLAAKPRLLVVAVEPREPGNVGTLTRCADAMGADAVVLLGDTVDPHNGKCIRSSAGSIFHVPIVRSTDISAGLAAIGQRGIATLATTMDGELSLDDADDVLRGAHAWIFGNEAHGLSDAVIAGADHRLTIPIRGRAESLNLAAASAICLYASARVHALH